MAQIIRAVYEDGILRPLDPLSLADHEEVTLTVTSPLDDTEELDEEEREEQRAAREIPDDLVPPNMRDRKHLLDAAYYLNHADEIRNPDPMPLEEVRRLHAHIEQSFSDLIRQERDEELIDRSLL